MFKNCVYKFHYKSTCGASGFWGHSLNTAVTKQAHVLDKLTVQIWPPRSDKREVTCYHAILDYYCEPGLSEEKLQNPITNDFP